MSKQDWHLDKKITIAMIITLGGVFATGILCYANLANDMTNNKKEITAIQTILDNRAQFGITYSDRVSKLETRVDYNEQSLKEAILSMTKGFEKISDKIDSLYDKNHK